MVTYNLVPSCRLPVLPLVCRQGFDLRHAGPQVAAACVGSCRVPRSAHHHSPGYQKLLEVLPSSNDRFRCRDLPESSGTRAVTGSLGTGSLKKQAHGPDNPACYMDSPYHLATTTIRRPGSTSSRQNVEVPPGTWPPWMDPDSVPRPGLPWVSPPVEKHAIQ